MVHPTIHSNVIAVLNYKKFQNNNQDLEISYFKRLIQGKEELIVTQKQFIISRNEQLAIVQKSTTSNNKISYSDQNTQSDANCLIRKQITTP